MPKGEAFLQLFQLLIQFGEPFLEPFCVLNVLLVEGLESKFQLDGKGGNEPFVDLVHRKQFLERFVHTLGTVVTAAAFLVALVVVEALLLDQVPGVRGTTLGASHEAFEGQFIILLLVLVMLVVGREHAVDLQKQFLRHNGFVLAPNDFSTKDLVYDKSAVEGVAEQFREALFVEAQVLGFQPYPYLFVGQSGQFPLEGLLDQLALLVDHNVLLPVLGVVVVAHGCPTDPVPLPEFLPYAGDALVFALLVFKFAEE